MACRRSGRSAALVTGLFALVATTTASADAPEDVALRMVQAFDLGSDLIPQGLRVAQRTHTYGMIAAHLGADAARGLVEAELASEARSLRVEWERILARSYLEHFSPEELESITREGWRSPFAAKLASERSNVESSVTARGGEFFTLYVGKALSRAFTKSLAEQP